MRILIATDGSPYAEAVLRLAAYLLQGHLADEPPVLLTVIAQEADRPQAEAMLARARAELRAEPLHTSDMQTKVRIGQPAREIIREATEGSYGLVLIGEGWRREGWGVRHLPVITAVQVAEHAPCPVLVAKGRVGPIGRILLCDSGAKAIVEGQRIGPSLLSRFTAQLAELLGGEEEVTVLHVMSQISAGPGIRGKQLRADVEELIREHAPEGKLLEHDVHALERPGVHPRPKVRHGLVVDEIMAEARSGDYNLVVIGAHPDRGWRRFLLEDLARRVLIQMDRPVLVVR